VNTQRGISMDSSRRLSGLLLFIVGILGITLIRDIASSNKDRRELYINDDVPLPDSHLLSVDNTVQDLKLNLALNTKLDPQPGQLQWPDEETEKFARIMVVALKRRMYDPLNHKWYAGSWGHIRHWLVQITPWNIDYEQINKFGDRFIADTKISPLILTNYLPVADVKREPMYFKIGPGQIYRIAEVLAQLKPFSSKELRLNDPDTSSTDELVTEALERANEAAATLPDGTKDLSHITLTAEEEEIVDWENYNQSWRNIEKAAIFTFGGAAVLTICYKTFKEEQDKRARQAQSNSVVNDKTIESNPFKRDRGPQNDFV
jgi:hypothetical protein